MGILDTFTKRAKYVLGYAQEEATHFHHPDVGTVHLLLGLIRDQEGVAGKVLRDLGIKHAQARSAVEFIVGHGEATGNTDDLDLTASAKKVLTYALEAGRTLNHPYVGTEHLLLGLVRTGEGVAAGVLEIMGVTLEQVRTAVLRALRVAPSHDPPLSALPQHSPTPRWKEGVPTAMYRSPLASPVAPPGTARILVVDDNPETGQLYAGVLAPAGYQVFFAHPSALAHSHDEYERPNLLLLDWTFGQEGRGFQILQQLLVWPATRTIATLVAAVPVTTIADLPGLLRAHGVTYLPKLFTVDELVAAVAAAVGPPMSS